MLSPQVANRKAADTTCKHSATITAPMIRRGVCRSLSFSTMTAARTAPTMVSEHDTTTADLVDINPPRTRRDIYAGERASGVSKRVVAEEVDDSAGDDEREHNSHCRDADCLNPVPTSSARRAQPYGERRCRENTRLDLVGKPRPGGPQRKERANRCRCQATGCSWAGSGRPKPPTMKPMTIRPTTVSQAGNRLPA